MAKFFKQGNYSMAESAQLTHDINFEFRIHIKIIYWQWWQHACVE